MSDPIFLIPALPRTYGDIAGLLGATLAPPGNAANLASGLAPLDIARPSEISFFDNSRYASALASTRAGACLLRVRHMPLLPPGVSAIVTEQPYRDFARLAAILYPDAIALHPLFGAGVAPSATIHAKARLEPGVTADPGAIIGPGAEIGTGTSIGANAVIGAGVRIGRDCSIGAHVSISHALIGDRVMLHAGVRIGQDGFGFAPGSKGHLKVPQLGRVIIQDDVEIGANSTIDRGALRDTIIGEGTKIDNLVQIGHNVVVGRHCIIVAQSGIAGSTRLGDFVAIGGQAAIAGHLTIGKGAQIAARSGVMRNVAAGARVGGLPAVPVREFLRNALRNQARPRG